jgi:ribosome-binding factor A
MRHFPASRERVRFLCADVGEEDGPAPTPAARQRASTGRGRQNGPKIRQPDHKAWQVCRQVAETLDAVLADCGDGVLQCLRVASIEPFPDASRLLVTVEFVDGRLQHMADAQRALEHLHRASGHLRSEVATAVTRRRAPLLVYRLAEPGTSSEVT